MGLNIRHTRLMSLVGVVVLLSSATFAYPQLTALQAVRQKQLNQDLFDALGQNDTAAVVSVLNRGANVNARDELGWTPLFAAVDRQRVDFVHLLLSKGGRVDARDHDGCTALIAAADFRDLDVGDGHEEERYCGIIVALLAAHAAINARNRLGKTALMAAVGHGRIAIFRLLLDHGAQVDLRDRSGRTALTWAAALGQDHPIVKTLLRLHLPVGVTEALLLHDTVTARSLIALGADVGVLAPDDRTPLMLAALQNSVDLVQTLLKRRVNVNAQDNRGITALMLTIGGRPRDSNSGMREWENKKVSPKGIEIVRLLLGQGARVGIEDRRHETALAIAEQIGDRVAATLLRQASVNR